MQFNSNGFPVLAHNLILPINGSFLKFSIRIVTREGKHHWATCVCDDLIPVREYLCIYTSAYCIGENSTHWSKVSVPVIVLNIQKPLTNSTGIDVKRG